MVKKKEDRSGWVAVEPETSTTAAIAKPIKPARSAYSYYQKINGSSISQELSKSSGATSVDVGALGKEVSSRWQALSSSDRRRYEEMAAKDRARFDEESRERDAEALARKERLQRERETLILEEEEGGDGGRRATRRARQKGKRKVERKRARKEEKRKEKKK